MSKFWTKVERVKEVEMTGDEMKEIYQQAKKLGLTHGPTAFWKEQRKSGLNPKEYLEALKKGKPCEMCLSPAAQRFYFSGHYICGPCLDEIEGVELHRDYAPAPRR